MREIAKLLDVSLGPVYTIVPSHPRFGTLGRGHTGDVTKALSRKANERNEDVRLLGAQYTDPGGSRLLARA